MSPVCCMLGGGGEKETQRRKKEEKKKGRREGRPVFGPMFLCFGGGLTILRNNDASFQAPFDKHIDQKEDIDHGHARNRNGHVRRVVDIARIVQVGNVAGRWEGGRREARVRARRVVAHGPADQPLEGHAWPSDCAAP